MQPPLVVYMDATIHPIVTRGASGFTCMIIITESGRERRGSGVLGTFDTEAEAYQYAVAFGRSDIERHRLMTLIC
ncbi:hypothetical protein [Burkholderia sp. S171]|jgi:hypothetical protein|uniref:hypothetical protein n=1 Tax=Burkholderia sp. S171 TaxID=1641860 RepID=UPI00131C2D97|nr:hypothetical protein [Burkholderia sp. S171]